MVCPSSLDIQSTCRPMSVYSVGERRGSTLWSWELSHTCLGSMLVRLALQRIDAAASRGCCGEAAWLFAVADVHSARALSHNSGAMWVHGASKPNFKRLPWS